jgi:hypothetical protein
MATCPANEEHALIGCARALHCPTYLDPRCRRRPIQEAHERLKDRIESLWLQTCCCKHCMLGQALKSWLKQSLMVRPSDLSWLYSKAGRLMFTEYLQHPRLDTALIPGAWTTGCRHVFTCAPARALRPVH